MHSKVNKNEYACFYSYRPNRLQQNTNSVQSLDFLSRGVFLTPSLRMCSYFSHRVGLAQLVACPPLAR